TTTGGFNSIVLGGNVSAPGNTVTLTSAAGISQNAGVISAATLSGNSFNVASLTGANQVGTFGPLTAGGTLLSFTDAQSLTVTGVSDAANVTLTTTGAGSNLTIAGDITAGGAMALDVAGTIAQTGGVISAATLGGGSVGGASMTGAN